MNDVVHDVVAFCRLFGVFEREQVCCGTVSVAQCVVLQTLLEGPRDATSLAGETRVTKGAITRLVDGLQQRGFVERRPDPHDGRRSAIVLTTRGETEARRLRELTERAVERILARIPEADRANAVRAIGQLREAVEEVRDQLDCC